MNNQNRNKFSWLIGLLIVFLASSLVIQFVYKDGSSKNSKDSNIKSLDASVTPPHIPQDFPGVSNQSVSYNYALKTDSGEDQGVRSFTNDKTPAENMTPYTNYFKKNGWTIVTNVEEKRLSLVSAFKDSDAIQVSITPGPNDKGSQVEITAYKK